jgi:hypothetical protein
MKDNMLNIFSQKEVQFLRENWRDFYNVIKNNRIRCLYHVTDSDNINNIYNANALLSKNEQNKRNIHPVRKGGNQLSDSLEENKGLVNYVHLSFTHDLPMFNVVGNERPVNPIVTPVVIEIDYRVIFLKFSKFSDVNALDNSAVIGSDLDDFQRINFSLIHRGVWENDRERKEIQAEILIQNFVAKKYFLKMYRI